MRIKLKDKDGSVLVVIIETIRFDVHDSELELFEFGSVEPDYVISLFGFDAERIIRGLLERGYDDFSRFTLLSSAFDDDEECWESAESEECDDRTGS